MLKNLVIFCAGVVVGGLTTNYIVKKKYEAIAEEEISEVKELYAKKEKQNKQDYNKNVERIKEAVVSNGSKGPTVFDVFKDDEEPEKEYKQYAELSNKYNTETEHREYTNLADKENIPPERIPYLIDPEDFGEEDGYQQVVLTYFSDGVLIDDVDDVIYDIEGIVGFDNLKVLSEPGARFCYIRNDYYESDYEVEKDERTYEQYRNE